ncbi:hypothetical protein LTR37_001899 [Vermiconidia calcicola]|uniref:Uncharacterized protein n=1 Tax=Vermiconidia calcicola TaxID=1690605 RepID=A0ACC3NUH8_9PEZI|nr:hypothetical protein LTR37_001899 [Vermiconidia calcicola]
MPRPQKYDWDDKKDLCYKLYVEEKLSAPKIVAYFATRLNVPESDLPTAKQFSAKFQQWEFPPRIKKIRPEEEEKLLERTKELFNQNLGAKQIQDKLNDEGWELDNHHFRAFRIKHRMAMRSSVAYKPLEATGRTAGKRKRSSNDEDDAQADEQANDDGERQAQPTSLPPEEAARRAQRLAELQAQSDHLLATRKRRRRIRGFGHLPPDAPGLEPRYGSETSLDECKAYLHLSNETYVQIRDEYEAICPDMGVDKMSTCVEGQWQASKDRLVRENMHLSSVLHPLQSNLDRKANALNVICMDVTKRMRMKTKALTIADANNMLGIDPNTSKEIRRILYDILEADQFTTVLACGKQHVEDLCEQWYAKSDILSRAKAERAPQKDRAIFLLSKDARKRYCDDQMRKHPDKRLWQKKSYGPGPGPAHVIPSVRKGPLATSSEAQQPNPTTTPNSTRRRQLVPVGPAWDGHEVPEFRPNTIADVGHISFDLDPELAPLPLAQHGPPWPPAAAAPPTIAQSSAAIPAYFRLGQDSKVIGHHPRMWLGKLTGPNIPALHKAATSKAGAATVAKVQGVVKNDDGSEDSWLIETDEELAVYLEEAGPKATFVVLLEGGYA